MGVKRRAAAVSSSARGRRSNKRARHRSTDDDQDNEDTVVVQDLPSEMDLDSDTDTLVADPADDGMEEEHIEDTIEVASVYDDDVSECSSSLSSPHDSDDQSDEDDEDDDEKSLASDDEVPDSQVPAVDFVTRFRGGSPVDPRDWEETVFVTPGTKSAPVARGRPHANIDEDFIGVPGPSHPPVSAFDKLQYTGVYATDPGRYPFHTWEEERIPVLSWRMGTDSSMAVEGRSLRSKFVYWTSGVEDAVAQAINDQTKQNARPARPPFHPPDLFSRPVDGSHLESRLRIWLANERRRKKLESFRRPRQPSSSSE
ncbi:hypothetical protein OQA88_10719 [Cercophora sp. LCS_1]